jgi:hypothetical protein
VPLRLCIQRSASDSDQLSLFLFRHLRGGRVEDPHVEEAVGAGGDRGMAPSTMKTVSGNMRKLGKGDLVEVEIEGVGVLRNPVV